MSKMLVLQGCPAAGKSTYAREFIKDRLNWIIVNRDSIRRMYGEYWLPERERLVALSEESLIKLALENNYNVIVDDSNLNPKTIFRLKELAYNYNAEIEFKKFDIPLDELLKRDANRENPVGKEVIRNFYNKYYNEKI